LALLVAGLPRERFAVHVCALEDGPLAAELRRAGCAVTVLGGRWQFDPMSWWRLRRYLAELRPAIVHAWCPPSRAYALPNTSRLVATWRPERSTTSAAMLVEWAVAARCRAIVVDCESARRQALGLQLPSERIRVIANGVAPSATPAVTRGQLLAQLGLPAGGYLIGLVGPLYADKGVKDAIWAADLLKVIRDDVHLLVFGDGPHLDRLRRFRRQVVINDKVHFLGVRRDLLQWLPHLDVFWSASRRPRQSNAILEAMAAGLPVVAADTEAARGLVIPQTTGYLVLPGHRAGLAARTQQLLEDAGLRRRFGEAAKQRAEQQFSLQRMIDSYAELYRDVMKI
jgi:glycosyltransferase involved in cell wall biosynthesis